RQYKTEVIVVECHRARPLASKDGHAPLTGDVVRPFGSVWMPMQFAHTARLNDDQSCRDVFRRQEVARVNNTNFTALGSLRGSHARHLEGVFVSGFDATPANSSLVLCQRCGQIRSK